MTETWKRITIKPFNKAYEVSSLGRIRSITRRVRQRDRGKIINGLRKSKILRLDYSFIDLHYNKHHKKVNVAYLVASAFLPNYDECRNVVHLNHNKEDNRVSNLKWINPTYKYVSEKWRDIPVKPYNKWYKISNYGRVLRKSRIQKRYVHGKIYYRHLKSKFMKLHHDRNFYLRVSLYIPNGNDRAKNLQVHRLVAKAFIPNPHHYSQVNHILPDEKDNNKVSNLEWCSPRYNDNYANHNERVSKTRIRKYGTPILLVKNDRKWKFPCIINAAKFIYRYYRKAHHLHNIRSGIGIALYQPKHHTAYGFKPYLIQKGDNNYDINN